MNQVKDYFDSCKKNYSEKILGIYLTLAGGEPNSTKDLVDAKKKILAISYKLIIDWLEECCVHKEIIRYPHIINSLLQYVTVLKRKLNIMEDAEKEKLKNWLEKDGDASFEILTNAQELLEINKEIVKDIRKEFHQELVNTVANSLKTINGFELPR